MLDPILDRRNKDGVMGLGEHLEELRRRLIYALVGLAPIVIVALFFGDQLLAWMLRPVLASLRSHGQDPRLQATSALETFGAYVYVSLVAGLVVAGPWLIYQLWKFVAPGLYSGERRFAYVLAPLSALLSAAGVAMMYFIMLPVGLGFLIQFGSDMARETIATAPVPAGVVLPQLPALAADPDTPKAGQVWLNTTLNELRACVAVDDAGHATIRGTPLTNHTTIAQHYRVSEFVDLFLQLTLAFVVAFQLPVVILLLGWAGLVTPAGLGKYRKYALIAAFVAGAVISPTGDPLSLAMLQVPLYMLYELGILLLRILPARRVRGRDERDERDDSGAGDAANDASQRGAPRERSTAPAGTYAYDPSNPPGGPADGP